MIIYRTVGAWGAGKGSNLTAAEVDENFYELALAILASTDDVPPVGIANIVVSGTQMTIVLDDATELGPYTLPVARFNWRGEFENDTAYAELDVFSVEGVGVFLVLQAHTSNTSTEGFDAAEENTDGPLYAQMIGATPSGTSAYTEVVEFAGTDVDFSAELTLGRVGALFRCSNDVGCAVSLPDDADLDYPIGTRISFMLTSPYGSVTFAASNLEYRPSQLPQTSELFGQVEAEKVDVDTWAIHGDLDAA